MAVTVDAPTPPPAGLSPKGQRAWEVLAAHEQRMAARRGGLRRYLCAVCNEHLFDYVPPMGLMVQRCRKCRAWYTFTTEQR